MSEAIINIFELASRQKLRFDTPVHSALTVEQLWDLPLQSTRANISSLDEAGKWIMRQLREQTEDSLVAPANNKVKTELTLKLSIIKRIIEVKQEENSAKLLAASNASEAATLKEILLTKKAAKLEELTEEQIEARLRALGSASAG